MAKFGCLAKFITMVRQFHDGMQARVQDDRVYSVVSSHVAKNRAAFLLQLLSMLTDAFRFGDWSQLQIPNCWKTVQLTQKPVKKDLAYDFLFADCALYAGTQSIMQKSLNRFATACGNFGLTKSIKKTEVMY